MGATVKTNEIVEIEPGENIATGVVRRVDGRHTQVERIIEPLSRDFSEVRVIHRDSAATETRHGIEEHRDIVKPKSDTLNFNRVDDVVWEIERCRATREHARI